jgi:transcriptional regulatory protein LevR
MSSAAKQTEDSAILSMATTCFDAIENNDIATAMSCFAPNLQVWQNTMDELATRDDMEVMLTALTSRTKDLKYNNRHTTLFPGGLVQQHVIQGIRVPEGERVSTHVCLVCKVKIGEDGKAKFTRVEQYFDSRQADKFRLPYPCD